jgi:hypothetical protein
MKLKDILHESTQTKVKEYRKALQSFEKQTGVVVTSKETKSDTVDEMLFNVSVKNTKDLFSKYNVEVELDKVMGRLSIDSTDGDRLELQFHMKEGSKTLKCFYRNDTNDWFIRFDSDDS